MKKESNLEIQKDYLCAISAFKSESAVIKLLALAKGIDVDGKELAEKIKEYPMGYRTKRAKKNTKLVNNQLFDVESDEVPFVPDNSCQQGV